MEVQQAKRTPEVLTVDKYIQLLDSAGPLTIDGALPEAEDKETILAYEAVPIGSAARKQVVAPSDQPEVVWFSLGPMYAALGIEFDIVQQFMSTYALSIDVWSCQLPTAIIPDMGRWTNTIEGVHKSHLRTLSGFLGQMAFKTKDNALWIFGGAELTATDQRGNRYDITVFAPASKEWSMVPIIREDNTVKFYRGAGNLLAKSMETMYKDKDVL